MENLENIRQEHFKKMESETDSVILGLGIMCLFLCSFVLLLDEHLRSQVIGGMIAFVVIVLEITLKPIRKLFN